MSHVDIIIFYVHINVLHVDITYLPWDELCHHFITIAIYFFNNKFIPSVLFITIRHSGTRYIYMIIVQDTDLFGTQTD